MPEDDHGPQTVTTAATEHVENAAGRDADNNRDHMSQPQGDIDEALIDSIQQDNQAETNNNHEDGAGNSDETESNPDDLFVGQGTIRMNEEFQWTSEAHADHVFQHVFNDNEKPIDPAFSDDEYLDNEDEQDGSASGRKKNTKSRKRSKKTANTPRKRQAKGKKAKDTALSNIDISTLIGGNVFDDVGRTAHLPSAPEVRAGANRADALRLLHKDAAASGLDISGRDDKVLHKAMQNFDGQRLVKVVDGGYSVRGIKTILKSYQVVGVGFMRAREKATDIMAAKGGILADTMGLGKTLMMLVNIVNGLPEAKRDRKPTLIVASPALIEQWSTEIEKHVDETTKWGLSKVVFYKSLASENPQNIVGRLERQDVVLATYHAVAKSFPKPEIPDTCVSQEDKQEWFRQTWRKSIGPLHKVEWHRVVLDEAHAIKNMRSRTSMACRALQAQHHWAISGTPVQNSLSEFYPYLRFIKHPLITTHAQFQNSFCDADDEDAGAKLTTLLSQVLLRRTHATTMFGSRILELPKPADPVTLPLDFNIFEQTVYEIVRHRFIERINTCITDTTDNKHRHIFAMFLRLRQLTGHILLLQDVLQDLLTLEDIHSLKTLSNRVSRETTDEDELAVQLQLKRMLEDAEKAKADENGPRKLNQQTAPLPDLSMLSEDQYNELGTHGLMGMRPDHILDAVQENDSILAISARTKCAGCHNKPAAPHVTSCGHVYCYNCILFLQNKAARFGRDHATCKTCAISFTSVTPVEVNEGEDDGPKNEKPVKGTKRKTKQKKELDWTALDGQVPASIKTKAVTAQILKWLQDDPSVKIIVYSQFLPMLRLLKRICRTEQWSFVEYTGKMSTESRSNAIKRFSDPKEGIQIFLASLKCGGQGLNLTAAAKVIIMDSWWNDSVEQQAFSRVYRIGQERQTQLTRFRVLNTIDDYMFDLKDRKQEEIDPIVESFGEKAPKLTIEEMMKAIGTVDHDAQGRPFIRQPPRMSHIDEMYDMFTEANERKQGFGHRG